MTFAKRTDSKYGAKRTTVDGIVFDSLKESRRYQELKLLELAGEIRALGLQPSWTLHAEQDKGVTVPSGIGTYRADFIYTDVTTGRQVVEDVKGIDTPLSKWKRKHLLAQCGINVLLT